MDTKIPPFVHLHAHTEYSFLDGTCRVVDAQGRPSHLLQTIKSYGMDALAITDHGNMCGVIEFYQACMSSGIKPIIGLEAYVVEDDCTKKFGTRHDSHHIILLAKNSIGYHNLMALTSISYIDGFYYKPRIDMDKLAQYSNGLIILSGCFLNGGIVRHIVAGQDKMAVHLMQQYIDIVGKDNFYLELMDHGLEREKKITQELLSLSAKYDVPYVATNDCHYLHQEDADIHDVLLCIGTGKLKSDRNRLRYPNNEFYYKSPEQMYELFKEIPFALSNTVKIAEQCHFEIRFDQVLLPQYAIPEPHRNGAEYLEHLCKEGLHKKYKNASDRIYTDRLMYELSVVKKMNFSTYFLIVWDFVKYAKQENIPVGPGRGSGAGSIISYCLNITDIDPIANGLIFERFLNPDRRTMPDLDIDFSDEGRDKIIDYVRSKYGKTSVAHIITYGSMMARSVIRDVGRVLNFSFSDCDYISKLIPKDAGVSIDFALKHISEFNVFYKNDEKNMYLIDVAKKLEGLKRHTGIHAAGIVIVPSMDDKKEDRMPLTSYTPLLKGGKNKDVIVTQYNDDSLLKLGILKMDFLGLKTLSIIKNTETMICKKNPKFSIELIPNDDAKTFKFLSQSNTDGIFQLESQGIRKLLQNFSISKLDDIVALIALYRPGPMANGMLDEFVNRKNNITKIRYDHECLKNILKDTYGVIVYQEQVMKISQVVADFSSSQADVLRKAMGKKIPEEIKKLKNSFLSGLKKKSFPLNIGTKIFDQIERFGGYGFNKSHASAYGLITYRTAFLKSNYSHEYFSALLTSAIKQVSVGSDEISKLSQYIDNAKSMGIVIMSPDVDDSMSEFGLEVTQNSKHVSYGLTAIKHVGSSAVNNILESREEGLFLGLQNFCKRVDLRVVNKKTIESLIKSGAFDHFYDMNIDQKCQYRANLLASYEKIIEQILKSRSKTKIQEDLFRSNEIEHMSTFKSEDVEPLSVDTLLAYEKEVLGVYFSGHPLDKISKYLKFYSVLNFKWENYESVQFVGFISSVNLLVSKKSKTPYAKFQLDMMQGKYNCVVIPRNYNENLKSHLKTGYTVLVKGKKEIQKENQFNHEVIIDEIYALNDVASFPNVILTLEVEKVQESMLVQIHQVLDQAQKGKCTVELKINTQKGNRYLILLHTQIFFTHKVLSELDQIIPDKVKVIVT